MARIAMLVAVLAASAAVAAVAVASTRSPKALRTAIFAAARKEHSVHYVEHGAASVLRQTMVSDVAKTRGIQKITFTLQGEKGQFTVIVVNRIAYLRGNSLALHGYLGFTSAQAARYHGRWISIPLGNGRYEDLAASVTLPSFLHDIYPGAPLALVETTVGGRKITGVRGTSRQGGVTFQEAVLPDAKLRPLAVSDVDTKHGFVDAIKIGRWNEPVRVKAPASAVPIATVTAG
ncbi:MAG TPA: hypothetical protein VGK69_08070 [Gaiellaceae bacterium]